MTIVACNSSCSKKNKVATKFESSLIANTQSRQEYLGSKETLVRNLLSKCGPDDHECFSELTRELYQVREELCLIRMDPLTHDICNSEPWTLECKVFD